MGQTCRSVSPDDDLCVKPRGHKSRFHVGQTSGKASPTRRWTDGIRVAARWEYLDDGYRTEGDYEAMRQMGVRW